MQCNVFQVRICRVRIGDEIADGNDLCPQVVYQRLYGGSDKKSSLHSEFWRTVSDKRVAVKLSRLDASESNGPSLWCSVDKNKRAAIG